MNFLEVMGICFLAEIPIEAYLIYKYRFMIARIFTFVLLDVRQSNVVTRTKEVYRDAKGRFTKKPVAFYNFDAKVPE